MAEPIPKVFITFRGEDIRRNFLGFLKDELDRASVKYRVDENEMRGQVLDVLLQRIDESRIVLIIFSKTFMDSSWCIKELLRIKENIGKRLKVIPIFFYVRAGDVKNNWKMGEKAKDNEAEEKDIEEKEKQVKEALKTITNHMGIKSADYKDDCELTKDIVVQLKRVLTSIELEDKKREAEVKKQDISLMTRNDLCKEAQRTEAQMKNLPGINHRLQKLQEKLDMEGKMKTTRVVGVLGMPGIGKTTLVKKLFESRKDQFQNRKYIADIHKSSERNEMEFVRYTLLKKLLKNREIITKETTHESVKKKLLETNVFIVLDDLTDKKQLEVLLGNLKWIKEGSEIVIVTSDKSVVDGLVNDTYVVPGLNETEALHCFSHYAFTHDNRDSVTKGNFLELSRKFVNYAKGNPLVLKLLGGDLCGRDQTHWESKRRQLEESPNKTIQDVLNVSYDGLTPEQKEAFLDVTCYFRSENHKFVTSLVDTDCEIKDLADKFLLEISDGRVEMHGLLYTLGKNIASRQLTRLWKHQDIVNVLKQRKVTINSKGIRGMFFDMSEAPTLITLGANAFDDLKKLRYLKLYDSVCQQECEAVCKLHFEDDKFNFKLEEIRYLHWLKFPLEELPQGFDSRNLIDLKLPHSKIKQLWRGVKDTRNLKWVDLNHSIDLCDISGLARAQNLERMNLEGCTELKELPEGIENMISLVFLNLRGCTSLTSLGKRKMKMKSLKTLILSNCSDLEDFQVISDNLKALYLDGTRVKRLPDDIKNLQKLILLNMKNCTSLLTVPDCLGNMEALEELVLSGCLKLKTFPNLKETMRRLRILLLDGTSIKEVPNLMQCSSISIGQPLSVKGLSMLRHLCLRGNKMIHSLQPHIGQLYHLKCIDLKHCKKLTSVPTFPPNLQCLDAHGCESLITIGNPLVILVRTDQIHSRFIFSNCHKLDEVAKSGIISYIEKKSRLVSSALNRYDLDSVVACFPGCEVPAWFSHRAYQSMIVLPEFRRHWSNNKIIGIVVCAVVSFTSHPNQNTSFLVKCTYEFKNKKDKSLRRFSCTVGGTETEEIESDHVFFGYTSWLHIKKQKEEVDKKKRGNNSDNDDQAYLRFEVTNGTGEEVKLSQVVKCGFSLVYEADETEDNFSWEVGTDPNISDEPPAQSEEIVSYGCSETEVQNGTDNTSLEVTTQNMDDVVMLPEQLTRACVSSADHEIIDMVMTPARSTSSISSGDHEVIPDFMMTPAQSSSCVSLEDHEREEGSKGEVPRNENIITKWLRKAQQLVCNMISICAGDSLMMERRTKRDKHLLDQN